MYKKLLLLSCIAVLTGCGTLFRGTYQPVHFSVSPSGSTITISNEVYTSPATISLKRNKNYRISISKEGYKTEMVAITKETNTGIALLGLITGALPLLIDMSTGALYDLYPPQIALVLTPIEEGSTLPSIPIEFVIKSERFKIKSPQSIKIEIQSTE